MAVDDPLNLLLALTAFSVIKYVSATLWRRRKLANFDYVGEISGLNIYPMKSCAALSLKSVYCGKLGLYHDGIFDRQWMVIRDDGMLVNIQQEPKMALIKPSIKDDMLFLDAPGMSTLKLETNPKLDQDSFKNCKVSGVPIVGMSYGKTASDWISKYIGTEGLSIVVSTPNMTKREVSKVGNKPWVNLPTKNDTVTFAEVGVCNIATESSLDELNRRLVNPVVMGNFRPSIVVKGSAAFDEDSWTEIRIGDRVLMRLLEPNPRCLLITVDPNGKRSPDTEPIKTLRKFRKSPLYGDSPLFGVTTAVDYEGMINIGDPVYVLRKSK